MNWTFIRTTILNTLAAQMIPLVEKIAIEQLLKHGEKLRGKADLALDLLMEEYRKLTAGTPLGLTDLDDTILKGLAQKALANAWVKIDEQIKQAARQVEGAVSNPQPAGPDPKGDAALGRPATDADFRPSFNDKPLE